MSSQPKALQTNVDLLYAEFIAARDKAWSSSEKQDAIAAGRAWSRFLAAYVPEGANRDAVHGAVVVPCRK
jgi:hypothetical protein